MCAIMVVIVICLSSHEENQGGFTMYKIILTIILLALFSVSLTAVSANTKQVVCHNGEEISVAQPAVSAHMNHGDTLGACVETSPEPVPDPDTMAAVVMMRCEAIAGNGVEVVSVSASFDYASIQPVEPIDCAVALANLLDAGFYLRSVTSGNAETENSLHLYLDYLLIGRVPVDS